MTDYPAVYEIRNTLTGKSYIGSTKNFQKRIYQHFHSLKKGSHPNPHLQNSYRLHSENAFVARAVVICEPFELLRYEQELIELWNPEYNICLTAGSPAVSGRPCLEGTKSKISNALIGRVVSEEARENMSRSHIGKPSHGGAKKGNRNRCGVKLSPAHREALRTSRLGINSNPGGNPSSLPHDHETMSKAGKASAEAYKSNPERQKAHSERMKKWWADRKAQGD